MTSPVSRVRDVAHQQHGVVTAAQARAAGMPRGTIDGHRDSGRWRALLAGTYLVESAAFGPRWSDLPFETRLSAGLLYHGPRSVAVLGTAARLHELQGCGYDDDVHIALPPGNERHQHAGIRLHTWQLGPQETTVVGGIGVTVITRTVADVVRTAERFGAVAVLDSALNMGKLDGADLDRLEGLLTGRPGAVEARRRIASCNALAQSPLETRVRLIASDAGLAPHHLQYPVRDRDGVILGYGDMAWERPGHRVLIVEADGREPHERPEALFRDRTRANDFTGTGQIDMVRFTWRDTYQRGYVVSVLRQNLGRSPSPRS